MKILLIEDDETWVGLLTRGLASHEVVSAVSTTQAIKLWKEHSGKFDAIICDHYLEEYNGRDRRNSLQIIRRIRADGFAGPMIATSSDEVMRDVQKEAGCSHAISGRDKTQAIDLLNEIVKQR